MEHNGNGSDPIIWADDLIAPGASWNATSSHNIWMIAVTTEPKIAFFDRNKGRKTESLKSIASEHDWYWGANVLYVYSVMDPGTAYSSPGIEVGKRGQAVWVGNGSSYITLDHLSFRGGNETNQGNIHVEGSYITFTSCEMSWGSGHGISFARSAHDNLVSSSSIHDNGDVGILAYQDAGTLGHETYIRGNSIYNNYNFGIEVLSNYYVIEYNTVYDNGNTEKMTTGIEVIDWTNTGWGQHLTIRYNIVYGQKSGLDDGEGIYADDFSRYVEIYHNVIYGNDGPGIGANRAKDVNIYGNLSYGNSKNSAGTLTHKSEFKIMATNGDESSNVVVKNNIGYATQPDTYAIYVDRNTYNSSGLFISDNSWYSSAENWYWWNNTGGTDLTVWNALAPVGTDLNADLFFSNGPLLSCQH